MQAYTYTIRHLPSNKIYYGVRKSSTFDLGTKYFSSSKLVKLMINAEPIENFQFKIRKTFANYSEARLHETKVLLRINAVANNMVLNQAISAPRLCAKNPTAELQRRESISQKMKQLWADPEYKMKQGFNKLTTEERSTRGKAGAAIRAANYAKKPKSAKTKRLPVGKEVLIEKNGITKTVKANQVPAYKKYGWSRTG